MALWKAAVRVQMSVVRRHLHQNEKLIGLDSPRRGEGENVCSRPSRALLRREPGGGCLRKALGHKIKPLRVCMIGVVVVVGEGAEWARRVHCAAVPGVESVANRTAFVFICLEWCFGFLFVAMYWERLMFSARNVFGRVTHTGAVFFPSTACGVVC